MEKQIKFTLLIIEIKKKQMGTFKQSTNYFNDYNSKEFFCYSPLE